MFLRWKFRLDIRFVFYSNRCICHYRFPSLLFSQLSINFYFHFHPLLCIFKFLFKAFSILVLFQNMSFSFQVFENVPVIFLILISSFVLLWSEYIPCIILIIFNFSAMFYDLGFDISCYLFHRHFQRTDNSCVACSINAVRSFSWWCWVLHPCLFLSSSIHCL